MAFGDSHPPVRPIEVAAYEHLEQVTTDRDRFGTKLEDLATVCADIAQAGCSNGFDCLTAHPGDPGEWCDECTIYQKLIELDLWYCRFILPGGDRCQAVTGHGGDHYHHQTYEELES